MATNVRFPAAFSSVVRVKAQRCYWKRRWQDPWTLVPELWCNSCTWNAAPTMPTAELEFRYGLVLSAGATQFAPRFKEANRQRYLVKIEYDTFELASGETGPLVWVGTVEIELDAFWGSMQRGPSGDVTAYASGVNHMECFGLEALLDFGYVTRSYVASQSGGAFWVERGLEFNKDGLPNRSTAPGPDGVYIFHEKQTGGEYWSSRDIVKYLLKYHTPRDYNRQITIPFELAVDGIVPVSDRPTIKAEGKTVRELLNSLIPRQRLLSWWLDFSESDSGTVQLTPFTMTGVQVDLGQNTPAIPANPNQKRLILESDTSAKIGLVRSAIDTCDQVIVRGARRTSTGSFSFEDGTLDKGWPDTLETEYEAAASTSPDYPAAGEVGARQIANFEARGADRFKPVYARFILPETFDGMVSDGIGGGEVKPLMPLDASPDMPAKLAPEDVRFVSSALYAQWDYSSMPGSPIGTQVGRPRPARPLVIYPLSRSTHEDPRYRQVDTIGYAAEAGESMDAGDYWSAAVKVETADGSLWVEVNGDPQDFLAGSDFSRLPEDLDPGLAGSADFRKMVATLTVQWSQYAEAAWPEQPAANTDVARVLELVAGDEMRLDYVVPGCIIAINPATGELVRSPGGFLRDSRAQLLEIAKRSYAWYSQVRRALSFSTAWITASTQIGTFVTAMGDPDVEGDVHVEDINSCVTQLQIQSPKSNSPTGTTANVPMMRVSTAFGELDALQLE